MQLVVTTDIGCSDSIQKLITIHEQPEAGFTFSPQYGAPPLEVAFQDESINGETYLWSFAGEGVDSVQNPNYIFQNDGQYSLEQIVYSEFGCADTAYGFIKVTIPSLDMAINKIYTSKVNEDQYLEIIAELINLGTREVFDFDIIASTSDGATILEHWNGRLSTSQDTSYVFSAAFELKNGQLPSVVCVNVEHPNGEVDDNSKNNEYCLSLSEFLVFNPYPNPANDKVYLDYVLPKTGAVKVELYNSIGKFVSTIYSGDGESGLNRLSFFVLDLSAEMYTILITYQEESEFKKFVKIDRD